MRDWMNDPGTLGSKFDCERSVAEYLETVDGVLRTIDRLYERGLPTAAMSMTQLLVWEVRDVVDGAMGLNEGDIEDLITAGMERLR